MNKNSFIFIGRSGSGKGTQAALLIQALKKLDPSREPLYVQTGQELRQFIQGNSFTQKITKKHYENGELMPEFIATYAWINVLVQKYNGAEDLIFDGTPRKLHEASVLNSIFDFYEFGKPWVIYIDIPRDEASQRLLLRKRMDDSAEDISKRQDWYETDVVPTVNYYKDNPKYTFLDINGVGKIEDIHADIVKKIGLR